MYFSLHPAIMYNTVQFGKADERFCSFFLIARAKLDLDVKELEMRCRKILIKYFFMEKVKKYAGVKPKNPYCR
jgi:hypothetical protein